MTSTVSGELNGLLGPPEGREWTRREKTGSSEVRARIKEKQTELSAQGGTQEEANLPNSETDGERNQ